MYKYYFIVHYVEKGGCAEKHGMANVIIRNVQDKIFGIVHNNCYYEEIHVIKVYDNETKKLVGQYTGEYFKAEEI